MSVSRRDLARQSVWFVACIGLLLTALSLSWQSIARADYLYPLWYEWLHISDHIDQFAPQNQQGKLGLDALPAESHHQLFHQIRQSVHRDGDGLRDITYQSASGRVHLLNAEEVVHLHDVARLITLLGHASDWIMPATLILVLLLTLAEISVRWRRQIALLLSLVLLATALVLVLGPTRVFYAMHVWIFPPENPWFFLLSRFTHDDANEGPPAIWCYCVCRSCGGFGLVGGIAFIIVVLSAPIKSLAGTEKLIADDCSGG